MNATITTPARIVLPGKTISTYVLFEVHAALSRIPEGDRLEAVVDAYPALDSDIRAWCRTSGNPLVDVVAGEQTNRFVIEKGPSRPSGRKLAAIISDDGLFELLSPLGFALAAALGGHEVVLYFQGPAVRILGRGYTAKMHGPGRPFSRFPRNSLAKAGHLPPEMKIAQLQELQGRLYACGPSMDHYKVDPNDLAFPDVTVASYPTFLEQMDSADIQLFV
jgi:TusA-related sulfurtransferase/predicted peroxiredoxin